MDVYLILLIVAAIASKINNNVLTSLLCLLLILFAGLRADTVGTDTYSYVNRYVYTGDIDFSDIIDNRKHLELIWHGLYLILDRLGLDSRWILGVASFITVGNFYIVARRLSNNVPFSMSLFLFCYYLFSFNGVRQMMAASIILVGYTFLVGQVNTDQGEFRRIGVKHYILYCLFILIAFLVHSSSWLYLPVLLLTLKKINKKILELCIVISYILGFFFNASFLEQYLVGFAEYGDLLAGGESLSRYNIFGQISHIVHIVLYLIVIHKSKLDEDNTSWGILQIFVAGVIVQNFLFGFSSYVSRVSINLLICLVIFIPNAIESMNISDKKKWSSLIFLVFSLFFLRDVISNSNGVFPYVFHNF